MRSNNGLMIYKKKRISFIKKGFIELLVFILLLLTIPFDYFVLKYWGEMPLLLKIIWIPIELLIIVSLVIVPMNGLLFTKKGSVIFVPDFRIIWLNNDKITRIGLVFKEWQSKKYSAEINLYCKNGSVFIKDYSSQIVKKSTKNILFFAYTISKEKIDDICKQVSDNILFNITIVDLHGNIFNYKQN